MLLKMFSLKPRRLTPSRKFLLLTLILSPVLLSACSDSDLTQQDTKEDGRETVIVIGAGLAGLNSALLLEAQGFDVTVLEARNRIGGRLYTLDNVPGRPEAGGNTIGANYARVIDRANALGLTLNPAPDVVGGIRTMELFVDGQFIEPSAWASFAGNPFPESVKRFPPGSMIFGALRDNPLQQPSDWLLEEYQKYDVAIATVFDRMGLDERSKELVNQTNSYGDTLESTSLLSLYRTAASYAKAGDIKGGPQAVDGGNQRLPEAMAEALKQPVLMGKVVTSITLSDTGGVVTTADGSTYKGDHVISSIPLTALRNISISPALPALQQRAINEIDYSKTLIVQLTVSDEYWGEHTPSLWTDTPIERIFATSLDGSGKVSNVTFWLTGANAMLFSAMQETARDESLLENFYAIYPQSRGKVALEQVVDWNSDPFVQGTWPAYKPGQVSAFGDAISTRHGRLYFAGEHTAVANTGMEGAMESSERVVAEVLRNKQVVAVQESGKPLFVACMACHSLGEGEPHKLGPNLHGFFGQKIASRQGFAYSDALKNSDIVWDKVTLKEWLQAPEKVVPGNRMTYRTNMSTSELDRLIDYVVTQTETESKP